MKRVGVLGGTFNPIHNGHLAIAEAVYEKVDLDKVLFIPSWLPPHKSSKNVLAAEERLKMVKMAVKPFPHFEPSTIEIDRKGKSYTIDTLKFLKESYSEDTKFYFIFGEDSLLTLSTWKNIEELLDLVTFIAVRRKPDQPEKARQSTVKKQNQKISKEVKDKIQKIRIINMPILDISSNEVRRRISSNKEVQFYIPIEVDQYIKKHKLYKKD